MITDRRLTDMLIHHNYDRFFGVVRTMSEQWIASLSALKMTCEIAERLSTRRYPPSPIATIRKSIQELHAESALLNDVTIKLRNLLWLRHIATSNQDAEHLQRDRWKPFDENAWDILFEQVVDTLIPAQDAWLRADQHIRAIQRTLPEDHPLYGHLQVCLDDGNSYAHKLENMLNSVFVKAQRLWTDN
jgi:hypothetical protein